MFKGWKCKSCSSARIINLRRITDKGKWMAQGTCEDCGVIMRFTKYGSYIYKTATKEIEGVPF